MNQRIYISDRRDSAHHRLTKIWLTQPLPALSAVYCTTCLAGRGWLSQIFVRRWHVLNLLSLMYVLWCEPSEGCWLTSFGTGVGRGVGSTRQSSWNHSVTTCPFATWHIYDIITLWLKYTYMRSDVIPKPHGSALWEMFWIRIRIYHLHGDRSGCRCQKLLKILFKKG